MSLKVWLSLNGNLENKGCSGIIVTNNGATTNINGKIGNCYSFNGSNNSLKLSSAPFNNSVTEFSYACWFKPTNSHNGCLFSNRTGINNTGITLFYYSGQFIFDCYDRWQFTPSTAITVGAWNHIVFTYKKGEKKKLYLNGTLINYTNASTNAPTTASATAAFIGASQDSSTTVNANWLNGLLNDVRIYDHCLSAAEVHEISQGLAVHYKLDSYKPDFGSNLVTGVTKGNRTTVLTDGRIGVQTTGENADTYFTINLSENITNGTSYILSCDASGISPGAFWGFPLGQQSNTSLTFQIVNGHNEYPFTANDISWGTNRLFMDDNSRTDWEHPACFYNFSLQKVNSSLSRIVTDSSGYGHHAQINDIAAQFNTTSSRYSQSIKNSQASNSSTYLFKGECNIPDSTNLTFTWWMNPTTWGAQTSGLFSTSNEETPTDYQTTAANMRDSCFDCCNISGSCVRINVASHLTLNQWHHYALTYNGLQLIFYKDGEQKVTASQSGALKGFRYIFPFFSKAGGANRCTSGNLSDFRIYCTTLSADDILALYHTSAKIDNKQNLHSFEFIENQSKINITKRGQTKCDEFSELTATKFKKDKTIQSAELIEF